MTKQNIKNIGGAIAALRPENKYKPKSANCLDKEQAGLFDVPADSAELITRAADALAGVTLSTLTSDQLEQVAGFAALQEAVGQLQKEAVIAKHDVKQLVTDWLATFASKGTQRMYSINIKTFLEWVTQRGLHCLTLTPKDIDLFASDARGKYQPAKANLLINTVGSFYKILQKWQVRMSPCVSVRRASVALTQKRIPSQAEIKQIASKVKDKNVATAIKFMSATGLRIGALATLKIKGNAYTGKSKGKNIAGKLPSDFTKAALLRMIDAAQNTTAFHQKAHRELAKYNYSCHALRHAFALDVYNNTGKDTEAVRRALGHSDLKVTTAYLAGLMV